MGRGLSPLQRQILGLAKNNRDAGRVAGNEIDLYHAEVYATLYGFRPRYGLDYLREHPGSQHFSRAEIGPQAYDAAVSAVSRAIKRLAARGLVDVYSGAYAHWSGIKLTSEGAHTAIGLVMGGSSTDSTVSPNGSESDPMC